MLLLIAMLMFFETPQDFELDGHNFHLEPWQLIYLNDFLTPLALIGTAVAGIAALAILIKYRKHFSYEE